MEPRFSSFPLIAQLSRMGKPWKVAALDHSEVIAPELRLCWLLGISVRTIAHFSFHFTPMNP
jgi:hypothetical protein